MLNLAAASKKRKLEIANLINNGSSNVIRKEQRCSYSINGNVLVSRNIDLISEILSRLPVETLMQLKAVCRVWRYLIQYNRHFINLQITSSETRLGDETTFLIYPRYCCKGIIHIKRVLFRHGDLRFDDSQDHKPSDTAAVVTSSNVTFKHVEMLAPVHGLVCFLRPADIKKHCAVLIYNPSTRAKTPWIETSQSSVFKEIRGVKSSGNWRGREPPYRCMFGFGIDPTTKTHKVLCIYKIKRGRGVKVNYEWVCGVFTVGENTWRKIDQVPSNMEISEDKYNCVHVSGSIYWMPTKDLRRQNSIIMAFDVGSETFRSIEIPSYILACWESWESWDAKKIRLVDELVDIDGYLTIIVREGDYMLNLWTYNATGTCSSVADDNLIKETMQLPCSWYTIHNLALKAISGTSLVVVKISKISSKLGLGPLGKEFYGESIQYYDRREKKYYRNFSDILWDSTSSGGFADTYSITPFFDTLLPVQSI